MFDLNGSGSDHLDPLVSVGIGGHQRAVFVGDQNGVFAEMNRFGLLFRWGEDGTAAVLEAVNER